MHNPFAKSKPNAKRARPRRTGDRVILRGKAKTQRRREIFERSGGRCEAEVLTRLGDGNLRNILVPWRCQNRITWETMQWSHPKHGPYKDDRYGIASCAECHEVGVHNPKSVPRKAGRKMNKKDAEENWKGTICCFCKGEKAKDCSFCDGCWCKLSAQSRHDLLNTNTADDYLQAVAEAEKELLAWKPAEEQVK